MSSNLTSENGDGEFEGETDVVAAAAQDVGSSLADDGLRKAIVVGSSYDVRSYAGVEFCPCEKESCAMNSAILSLGAMTPDGQLSELVREVKRNGQEKVLTTREGENLVEIAERNVDNEQNRKGLNKAEILALLIYTGTKVQHKFRRDMMGESKKTGTAEERTWPYLCALLYIAILKQGMPDDDKDLIVWHGLHNVWLPPIANKFDEGSQELLISWSTFISASRDKQVAERFASGVGVKERHCISKRDSVKRFRNI